MGATGAVTRMKQNWVRLLRYFSLDEEELLKYLSYTLSTKYLEAKHLGEQSNITYYSYF